MYFWPWRSWWRFLPAPPSFARRVVTVVASLKLAVVVVAAAAVVELSNVVLPTVNVIVRPASVRGAWRLPALLELSLLSPPPQPATNTTIAARPLQSRNFVFISPFFGYSR